MKKVISLSLILLMLFGLCISVCADPSPEDPGTDYKVEVFTTAGGSYTMTKNPDGSYSLTAIAEDGHYFSGWLIKGEYELLEGSLTSTFIRLIPGSDCSITACYDNETETTIQQWTDNKSPKTGDSVAPLCAFAAFALAGTAFCVVKSKKHD